MWLFNPSLPEKLEELIAHRRRADGKRFTNSNIANGSGLSKTYIQKLRTDPTVSPTLKALEKLAHFFGVNPLFFSSDPDFYIPPVPNEYVRQVLKELQLSGQDKEP